MLPLLQRDERAVAADGLSAACADPDVLACVAAARRGRIQRRASSREATGTSSGCPSPGARLHA